MYIFRPLEMSSPRFDIDDIDDLVEEFTVKTDSSSTYFSLSLSTNLSICLSVYLSACLHAVSPSANPFKSVMV